jgi:hypothetical protein
MIVDPGFIHFFGLKTQSWFDVWSIEHFISGILIGSLLALLWPKTRQPPVANNTVPFFLALLTISFIWESVEFYLEAGYSGSAGVTHWFQGVEFWGNRVITDPLMVVAGAWCFLKSRKLVFPARIFSTFWLVSHVLVFPHSMYLHTVWVMDDESENIELAVEEQWRDLQTLKVVSNDH